MQRRAKKSVRPVKDMDDTHSSAVSLRKPSKTERKVDFMVKKCKIILQVFLPFADVCTYIIRGACTGSYLEVSDTKREIAVFVAYSTEKKGTIMSTVEV